MKKLIVLMGLIAATCAASAAGVAKETQETKGAKTAKAASASASASVSASAAASAVPAANPGGTVADWRVINSDNNAEMSVDAASIKEIGKMRQVWAMWNFKEARPNQGDPSFPALKSYQDMYILNCEDKTMRLSREIIYADNYGTGDKRDHSDALTNMTYDKPAEGSVAETLLKQVCAFKLAKKK
ncbi:MAG: surface-adhesin E family protein [Pseudomonadota bacterium]